MARSRGSLVVILGVVAVAIAGGWQLIRRSPLAADTTGLPLVPSANADVARLHNGWTLNPHGHRLAIEDMPTAMVESPDGKHLIVATAGYQGHGLRAFDIPAYDAARPPRTTRTSNKSAFSLSLTHFFRGLTFGRGIHAQTLFASGGPRGHVWRLTFDPAANGFMPAPPIQIPGVDKRKAYVGGLAALADGRLAVLDEAANVNQAATDTLHLLPADLNGPGRTVAVGVDSGATAAHPTRPLVFVAEHGTGELQVIDADAAAVIAKISVGKQPNAVLALSDHVLVANSGSDTVSVIRLADYRVVETIRTAMSPQAPLGSIPNALAVSRDGKVLFVSNGGNNNVAMIRFDPGESQVLGFIPSGWYPVSVHVSANGFLFTGAGKGFKSAPNAKTQTGGMALRVNHLPGEMSGPKKDQDVEYDYILSTITGGITRCAVPGPDALRELTRVAELSSPYRDARVSVDAKAPVRSALPADHRQTSPFEHVVYIIKENRTYDQVFGDMKKGNGDPNLVLFGRDITPNHHRIAEQFVLLDNTYCDGEVSQDGWEWSTAALDSDWDIKATVNNYSGRPNTPGSREEIRPANGYIWEAARDRGKSIYSYGAKTFRGLFSPTWKGAFSQAWNEGREKNVPDHQKADIFLKDLAEANRNGKWPNLVLVSLTDDHTSGTTPGTRTPAASVASNDLALGKIVEALTKSRFWPKMAIFVIEDDAQNGPDHVDAHRTVALVASPYTRRGSLDSTLYTSTSMVRSIGLALGLPPLSQYDAGANPMFRCFTGSKNLNGYTHVVPKVDLTAKNPPNAPLAELSKTLDFSDVDLADFGTLNRILWAERRPGEPYPGPQASYVGR
ncbi:MAG: hypothetical protein SFX74_04205 [Fimbriimonadaceae bacterium]|nr:hypothetical protein [Fimbriimonadaceae bacterium]